MDILPIALQEKLVQREREKATRALGTTGGLIDFSSNDYLGLAASETVFKQAHQYLIDNNMLHNGATGSRLITGNHRLYAELEDFLAGYHEAESALLFNSGYDANIGFFSSVPQKGDVVLYDEYIHASVRDGIKLGLASGYKFPHNDADALYALVERHRSKAHELYIVTESVFSMDGDTPNLQKFAEIAKRYKCRLVVDEAHAIGVLGTSGKGLVQLLANPEDVFARLITFGKAYGAHGAAILCAPPLREYLLNFARSFIYTTALPPHNLATILMAYREVEKAEAHIALHHIIMHFKEEAERLHLDFILSFSAIQCLIVPGNELVRHIARFLQANDFSVKPILSPTVPQGQERLRFCLHAYNTKEQVTKVLELLKACRRSS